MPRHRLSSRGAVLTILLTITTTLTPTNATYYTCPPIDTPTIIAPSLIDEGQPTITITVGSTTTKSSLCTLTRRQSSTSARRIPVARSYAGRVWEKSAGLFARSGSGLLVDCSGSSGGSECELTLPSLGEDQEYVLESFSYEVSPEVEAARFLEQATFGPTRESINTLLSTSNNFASWIHTQMYSTPPSYHREFLRRNTHPKFEYPYLTAAVGPRPCEQYSRWRRYAITSRDLMDDRKSLRQKHLVVETVEGITGFLWMVDGTFRTVTQDHPTFVDGTLVQLNVRYRIDEVKRSFLVNCIGCHLSLIDGNGVEYTIANPPVSIEGVEGNEGLLPYATVALPSFGSSDFPAVEKASENFPLFTEWMKDDENALLTSDTLESSNQCDGFPSFRQPEAVAVPTEDAPLSILPTVFGKSLNSVTGVEEVFAYDPHLFLHENTPENPLADGGGQLVLDTYKPLDPGHQVLCHNVHRAHDNEDGCQLSYLETACAPDTLPKETIVLDSTNLAGIRALTGRSLYAVSGLTIDEEFSADEGVLVSSVLNEDAILSIEGCNSWSRGRATKDRNTEKFWCDRQDIQDTPTSIVFRPPKSQLSIVHKLRVYTSNTSTNSDPASFILEGRVKPDAEWEVIGSGDLDLPLDRNNRGIPINSSYDSGDAALSYSEVSLSDNTKAYWDYKVSFPATRDPTKSNLQLAEVELPGLLLPFFPISHSCAPGAQTSRWRKELDAVDCPNTANLGEGTYKLFSDLVSAKPDVYNPTIRTVTREYRECDSIDAYKLDLGMVQASDGTCWKHVHDLEHTIFDLTGADQADYTVTGSVAQVSNAFVDGIVDDPAYPIIGNLDDHSVIDNSSNSPLDQQDVQDAFMTLEYNPSREALLVCGSPGEVATNPFASDHSFDITTPQKHGVRTMNIWELSAQRHTTWAQMAMHADDQLRQRQSWALSQIIAVGLPGSGMVFYEANEPYPSFYDQYVRNGFGSYRKLLKDMSFNLIMAEWLTFKNNKSLQHNINNGLQSHPDENYAREIMQLFSIGLFMLNMDGSKVLDGNGQPVETYTIDDIMSYAGAWTGFEMRNKRGGASASNRHGERSLDPLYINPETRDHFPKSNLYDGFIGDQIALCNDLPDRAFLRKGATFMLLGSDPTPTMLSSDVALESDPDRPQMELLPSSPLFARLCSQDSTGDCTFPAKVILEDNLLYDEAAKLGIEYEVDTLRTVEMKVGMSHPVYYEYIRQPCVEHSFYSDAKKVIRGQVTGDAVQDNVMCADPTLPVATSMCLEPGSEQSVDGAVYCNYVGERMTFESAIETCAANGLELGEPWLFRKWYKLGPCARGSSSFLDFRSWTNSTCQVKVKVSFEEGKVAIVHSPPPDHAGMTNVEPSVSDASLNFFKTPWTNGNIPSLNDCLSISSCYVHDDESCICDTEVAVNGVFTSSSEISSIADLKAALHIGAADPQSFDSGYYTNIGSCGIDGLNVYSTAGDCNSFDSDAVFSFEWKSKPLFLKNIKSDVYISGSDFSFRNPVQFISVVQPEARDMYHETDEVIDSLFYHPSHPPFLAMRLAQRFGLSNASPSLIERVAKAYEAGTYEANNLQFGSGKFGDLGAMIAAILLDPESREAVLDADQSHGQAKAPLDKVISVFRSMGLKFESPLAMPTLIDTFDAIGQGSFESPSVFNFYLVEYGQPGVIQNAGLTSPETSLYQSYRLLHLLDAMSTTVKFGINDCPRVSRFEGWRSSSPFQCSTIEGNTDSSPAHFSYWPSSVESVHDILEELSLLLTSGRIKASNEALIASLVQPIFDSGDIPKAIRAAQQYILTTPEAHTTGISRINGGEREIKGYESKPRGSYKALVFLNFAGGVDSYNLLVPKGQCGSSDDGYAAYAASRGNAIPLEGLTSIFASDQVCKEFGVHSDFSLLADLYNQTIFFANIGTLFEPMTRHDKWRTGDLFAHNAMQHQLARGDPYDEAPDTGVFGRLLDMLQRRGHHTSANNLKGEKTMLQGFPENRNTVHEVSLSNPKDLNQYPTVTDLIDVAKQLNGVGELGNSFFGEAWSESVSAAFFEHEQSMAMAAAGIEVTDYPLNEYSKLSEGLNAIANHMLSRDFRNVNRDIYVLRHGGFDMHHSSEDLAPAFQDMNVELGKFVNEMQRQGIWEDVAIVFGSEFGRSVSTNSGGGTDHGWGGHAFLIGGGVNGGKVLGDYPHPLNSAHVQYTRGRMIPTTPHEFVWNGVAQWLGVRDESDLDLVLPNSKSFNKCDHFTDKDLFVDGACDCTIINGECSCQCDNVTYSPTVSPTVSPSELPSTEPTSHPSSLPSVIPSVSPTLNPTDSPTADLPDGGILVSSIIDNDSSSSHFGCNSVSRAWASVDGSLEKFHCDRTDLHDVPAGQIFSPPYVQATIAKKVRVYASDAGTGLDPIGVMLEGRINPEAQWEVIGSGDLEYSNDNARNVRSSALYIESTYESGDMNYTYAEVNFPSNDKVYSDYKVSYLATRNYDSNRLQFAELEIPGMLLPPPPTPPPTLSPSFSPTKLPTAPPTPAPTPHPTAAVADGAQAVNTVLYPGSVQSFGCSRTVRAGHAISPSTEKYFCDHLDMPTTQDGIWVDGLVISPAHGKLSVAKDLRLYTHNNCVNCDCVEYLLEGRVDASSAWEEISSGDLPWKEASICRNSRGELVNSTFESGDNDRCYESVGYPSHSTPYLDYKYTCLRTRGNNRYHQLGRIELAGYILE